MNNISHTEENYLKAIFKISEKTGSNASTNAIAQAMDTSAASVTDMIQRLSAKSLINYEKYKGVTLSEAGQQIATSLIRKHRLWEVFLVEQLQFSWDEVHEIAEQLEHIKSEELVRRLDSFLEHPKFDPHGDPIPDAEGNFTFRKQVLLMDLDVEEEGIVVGVQDTSTQFLQYLDQMKLVLGVEVKLLERFSYDESIRIEVKQTQKQLTLSKKVCQNIYVQRSNSV
ncbi:MAG: metal-dependent transcriptional regulator [Bacteroidota bacterium]